jgi:2,3-bisphosphoglycerate-independent phosphoglycerate mutase
MKTGYVLLDGCGDRPDPRLNFTTPLEAASTPNLDTIAGSSKLGRVITVGRGVSPESDIAVFNMLGYSFASGYPGRGVVESVGAGLAFKNGNLALRANLASVRGGLIVDRRAGRNLTQREGKALEKELNEIKLDGAQLVYKSTVSYRGVLVIRAKGGLSASISNTDPAYSRVRGFGAAVKTRRKERVLDCIPDADEPLAKKAARLVNEFTRKARKVLDTSPTNSERRQEGKLPANCVLLRDAGDHLPDVPSFEEKYGVKGTALVEMPAEVGIAKILGMRMVELKDRNDMKGKAAVFRREMKDGTVVYVHIKGPDEFGHDGDAVGKRKSIESIDRDFFSAAADTLSEATLGVSCDHATPCKLAMHSSDPVPLLITSKGSSDHMRFTERNAKKGSLGLMAGKDVLARVMRER